MNKAILLDIEGTTTPIDFVHKVLFPFAKERISDHLAAHLGDLGDLIADLELEHSRDACYRGAFDASSPQSVSVYLQYLIDVDRKSTPLKAIQGEIWRRGYESGTLRSEVFDDVPRALARWKADGKTIAIYSSGSVLAQQLLFRYTGVGDLSGFISHYFDTNVGGKREKDSYSYIAESLSIPPASILFVSDIPSELAAARDAGLTPVLSVRRGNTPIENVEDWSLVTTFNQID